MFTEEKLKTTLTLFNQTIQEKKGYLNELDTPIGDGDHGTNMARGMDAVMHAELTGDVSGIFKQTAMALITKVGGASGPLYGTAMLEMAKASKENTDSASLLKVAYEGIEKRGASQPGQKTMLDVWVPAVALIEENKKISKEEVETLAEATKDLIATKGRASYVGERSKGYIDPGAMSSAYLFEAMIEAGVFADD